jgi:hypothetical protein
MKRTLLGALAAVAAAVALSAFGFATTAAAQDDKQPTHAELVQCWAEAAINGQLKSMKTSLRLSADQEKLWDPFESAVKDGENARLLALQREQGDNLLTAHANGGRSQPIHWGWIISLSGARMSSWLILSSRPHAFVHGTSTRLIGSGR